MSENSTPEERTEMPTGRRMGKLRKEGQVHFSGEVAQVLSLMTGFIILQFIWSWLLENTMTYMRMIFKDIALATNPMTEEVLFEKAVTIFWLFAPPVAIIAIAISVVSSLAILLQTKFCVKDKWIKFKWNFISPINGVKKIISVQGAMTTLKALAKLALILPIGYFSLKDYAPGMVSLIHLSVKEILHFTGDAMWSIFWKIMYVLIILAIIDYFWTKYQWLRSNKMTKDEVKDERKAIEGDEKTKRQIQAKGLQRIMQRIRDSVPQADVVITNPTHYAIALKYDRETMAAPQVVAKGKGFLAKRIREIAKESNVPVLERKALARALYNATEVGSQIPYELFKAVAEVLAYVYRLKNPYGSITADAQ